MHLRGESLFESYIDVDEPFFNSYHQSFGEGVHPLHTTCITSQTSQLSNIDGTIPRDVLTYWNVNTPYCAGACPAYLPAIASEMSSTEITSSYVTTPPSSNSLDKPRTPLSLPSKTSLANGLEAKPAKYTAFITEDPSKVQKDKSKHMRSCMLCFTRNKKCATDRDATRCTNCAGKRNYCKGPIIAPELINLEKFRTMAGVFLKDWHRSIDLASVAEPTGSSAVKKFTLYSKASPAGPWEQNCSFTIAELHDDFWSMWDCANLDNLFDMFTAASSVNPAASPFLYDLSRYKRLCHRFCACISLFRSLDKCTIDTTSLTFAQAVHIIAGFLCQLSRKASSLFLQIFDEVKNCCCAKRNKKGTKGLMFTIADQLGAMHQEIMSLHDSLQQRAKLADPLRYLFCDVNKTLNFIQRLAEGLRAPPYNFANRSAPLVAVRLHVMPIISLEKHSCTNVGKGTSFLDILNHPTRKPLGSPAKSDSAPINMQFAISERDSNLPVPKPDREFGVMCSAYEAFPSVEKEVTKLQCKDIAAADNCATNFTALRPQAADMIPQEWTTTPFEDFTSLSNPQAWNNHNVNVRGNSKPERYDYPTQTFTLNPLDEMISKPFGIGGPDSPSQGPRITFDTDILESQISESDIIISSEVMIDSKCTGAETMTTLQKRRRSNDKSLLACKRYRSTVIDQTSQMISSGTNPALRPQNEAAKTAMTSTGRHQSRDITQDKDSQNSRNHQIIALEKFSALNIGIRNEGIAPDMSIAECDRRPKSWPRRHSLRKSFEISIAVLRKRFENSKSE